MKITNVDGEQGNVKEFQYWNALGLGVFMEEIIKELEKRNVNFE